MFLDDFVKSAEFKKTSKTVEKSYSGKKRRKKGQSHKGWNNWEKAREIRSGLSTASRVSADTRSWLRALNVI